MRGLLVCVCLSVCAWLQQKCKEDISFFTSFTKYDLMLWLKGFFFFLFHMNWLSVTACRKRIQMASAVRFSIMSALAEDTFIFSQTFYLITVPSGLLVLPLPVCFRGNPSFVSQGSSANSENLKLSSELKQLERIWLRRVTARCISQHSRLVITSARETTHCKSSTVKQFPELSITVPELCCNTETQGALGIAL